MVKINSECDQLEYTKDEVAGLNWLQNLLRYREFTETVRNRMEKMKNYLKLSGCRDSEAKELADSLESLLSCESMSWEESGQFADALGHYISRIHSVTYRLEDKDPLS